MFQLSNQNIRLINEITLCISSSLQIQVPNVNKAGWKNIFTIKF